MTPISNIAEIENINRTPLKQLPMVYKTNGGATLHIMPLFGGELRCSPQETSWCDVSAEPSGIYCEPEYLIECVRDYEAINLKRLMRARAIMALATELRGSASHSAVHNRVWNQSHRPTDFMDWVY